MPRSRLGILPDCQSRSRQEDRMCRAVYRVIASSPARLFTQIDAECGLCDDLMDKEAVCRVKATAARVAEQALQLIRAEHAGAAGYFHGFVDNTPACLDCVIFGRDQFRRPCSAVID